VSGPDFPDFMRRTPAERAGLIGASSTSDDEQLWRDLRDSPQVAQLRAERRAARLAHRRELLERLDAERDRIAREAVAHAEARAAAEERLKRAEAELRAAMQAARQLPLMVSDGSQLLVDIERELRESADPRIGELAAWLEREVATTRMCSIPDASIAQALAARLQAIHVALGECRALELEALEEPDLVAALERILAAVPPVPERVTLTGAVPVPLPAHVRAATAEQRARDTRIAAIDETHRRVAARAREGMGAPARGKR
jgi:hypothetical protein